MTAPIRKILLFIASFAAANCLLALGWSTFVTDRLYQCSDSVGAIDYLTPGAWVHGDVVTVPVITPSLDMSGPDTIKEGWSQDDLLLLWLAFQTTAATVGLFITSRVIPPAQHACCR